MLVKSVCSHNPAATAAFEALLFPPFQTILQMEVSERRERALRKTTN